MDKELNSIINDLVDEYVKAYNEEMYNNIKADMDEINAKIDNIYKLLQNK